VIGPGVGKGDASGVEGHLQSDPADAAVAAGVDGAVVGEQSGGITQAAAASRKQASTSAALNTGRHTLATHSREWSSTMLRISTSVPSARTQWVMSVCHSSLGMAASKRM
jgi:hypothetical protein